MSKTIFDYMQNPMTDDLDSDYDYDIVDNSLPQDIIEPVTNFQVVPEVNSFSIKWSNPETDAFSYVVLMMAHASTSDGCVFQNAVPVYIGSGNSFSYYLPEPSEESDGVPQRDYFRFWISAFSGSVIDTKKLELWQVR
mgnify:CR=1 FL=1